MKVILTTLNAKFIHSSLALRYLKAYSQREFPGVLEMHEYTINHHVEEVLADLYKKQGDVYCFSCYIFNIEETVRIIQDLRKAMPHIRILVGGPEVSFESKEFLKQHPEVDLVIRGEGEITFHELLQHYCKQRISLDSILGITYKNSSGEILENQDRPLIHDLDEVPFPYTEGFEALENRIVYYETTRGCPYRCQYCLSSTIQGVRYFSLERVKKDLQVFIDARIKQVKFVDRTFNCNKKRTLEIWKWLQEKDQGITNFHFEMAADLIDEEMVHFLATVRPGLLQFEIGVQSTNEETLQEIQRTIRFDKLKQVVSVIQKQQNIHQHLDLIAGLPKEDYASFGRSFDDVYALQPDKIQMGFLKLLKGSGLRERAEEHGYVYREYPPYEVLYNQYISFSEMLRLKGIEELVESYYNGHKFEHTLQYILKQNGQSPFAFFESLYLWWEKNDLQHTSHKDRALYDYLYQFYQQNISQEIEIFREILKFDLLLQEKVLQLPDWANKGENEEQQKNILDFYWREEEIEKLMPELVPYSPKQRARMAHIEIFHYDVTSTQYEKRKTAVLFYYHHAKEHALRKVKYYQVSLDKPTEEE